MRVREAQLCLLACRLSVPVQLVLWLIVFIVLMFISDVFMLIYDHHLLLQIRNSLVSGACPSDSHYTFRVLRHWWIELVGAPAAFLIEGNIAGKRGSVVALWWSLRRKKMPSSSVDLVVNKQPRAQKFLFYHSARLIWDTPAIFLYFLAGLCCLTAVLVWGCVSTVEGQTSQTSTHWLTFVTHDHQ